MSEASVRIDGEAVGEIEAGLCVLVGYETDDGDGVNAWAVDKLTNLRVFEDELGKMNRSVEDVGGSILLVPNFTLLGDAQRGRRPSFTRAMEPRRAEGCFELLVSMTRQTGVPVASGRFGADMKVSLTNDGPITLVIDSPARLSFSDAPS